MQVIHFSRGATDPLWGPCARAARFVPLADGHGDTHVSCLHLSPRGKISQLPVTEDCAVLIVHGHVIVRTAEGRVDLYGGVGFVLKAGEHYGLESPGGAILVVVESQSLEATQCGISTPLRIMGQRWPGDESWDPGSG